MRWGAISWGNLSRCCRLWRRCGCCLRMQHTRAPMWQVPSTVRETASPNGPCVIRRPAVSVSSTSSRKGVAGITQDWTGGLTLAVSGPGDGTCPICARCRITNFEHAASPCCARSTQPPQPESRTLVKVAAVGAASTVRSTGQRRALKCRGAREGDGGDVPSTIPVEMRGRRVRA